MQVIIYGDFFSGFIQNSTDILYAELFTIIQGCMLAKEMDMADLVCYPDSMHCINLIKGPAMKFHGNAVLIKDIKELFDHMNFTICHTLKRRQPMYRFYGQT